MCTKFIMQYKFQFTVYNMVIPSHELTFVKKIEINGNDYNEHTRNVIIAMEITQDYRIMCVKCVSNPKIKMSKKFFLAIKVMEMEGKMKTIRIHQLRIANKQIDIFTCVCESFRL